MWTYCLSSWSFVMDPEIDAARKCAPGGEVGHESVYLKLCCGKHVGDD